ncbi:PepSY domain-containing protein [Fodinibius halophilus]|uniref:PepSY domain-containing protein n=1 Tax=Fodinibius halophilus TaxID=1736908 RepID=A0A6M1T2L1_9BACT|nr:PepSY domain-containing protein [Fodinibius halophilus]NGP86853.1 PepSY domain-containing protein [Fodinibius halophilus]
MMGSFGGMEMIIMLIVGLLPTLLVVGYFLWMGSKINTIARDQAEQTQEMRKLVKLLKEEGNSADN